jgi:hypothetical protein
MQITKGKSIYTLASDRDVDLNIGPKPKIWRVYMRKRGKGNKNDEVVSKKNDEVVSKKNDENEDLFHFLFMMVRA